MRINLIGVQPDTFVRDARYVRGVRVDAHGGRGVRPAQLADHLHCTRVVTLEVFYVEHVPCYHHPRASFSGVVLEVASGMK